MKCCFALLPFSAHTALPGETASFKKGKKTGLIANVRRIRLAAARNNEARSGNLASVFSVSSEAGGERGQTKKNTSSASVTRFSGATICLAHKESPSAPNFIGDDELVDLLCFVEVMVKDTHERTLRHTQTKMYTVCNHANT